MASSRRQIQEKKRRRADRSPDPVSSHDLWSRLPGRYQHLKIILFLLIVPSFLFSEVYFGGQQFVAHDIQQFRATAQSVIAHQEETGEDALWASRIFSGMPSYTVIRNNAFTHLDTLLRRTFPALFIPAIPLALCSLGVYFLLWVMGFRPLPSAFAALAITLTTYIPIIVGAGHNSKLIAYCWMPWVLAGYRMISRDSKQLAGVFLFALALNFALRAEHIQVVYYFLFVLGLWFVYDTLTAFRRDEMRLWYNRAGLVLLAGFLAAAANIQPYWSIYEYSSYSIRGGSELRQEAGEAAGLDPDYAFAWSQGRGELLTLLVPNAYGGSSSQGTYWGPKSFTSGPHYMGALVFLMFLIGLVRDRGRLKYVFLGSGLLALFFSLGNNLLVFNQLFFNYMPFFNKFRTPEMWLIITVFSFSIIAAMGMKWIHQSWKKGSLTWSALFFPGGLALGIALVLMLIPHFLLSFEKPGERATLARQVASQQNVSPDNPQVQQFINRYVDQQLIPERRRIMQADSRRFFFLILLGCGLLGATVAMPRKFSASYALAGLLLLTAADLVQVGKRYADKSGLIPARLSAYDALSRQVRSLDHFIESHKYQKRLPGRAPGNDPSAPASLDGLAQPWPWRTFPLSDSPFNNAVPAAFVYPSVGGYSGAKLSHYQDVIDHVFFDGPGGLNLELLNMLNTRFLVFQDELSLPGWEPVYHSPEGVVMENGNVLPKAFFVDSLMLAGSAQQAIDALQHLQTASTAILQNTPELPTVVPTSNRSVEITAYGPREIRIQAQNETPSFLVLSEIYYPAGWHAYRNGEPESIYRTNYILRGFALPAGEHELVLRFDPRSHILGSRINRAFNWLILLIGVVLTGKFIYKRYWP